ncbi:acetylajmalan esterase-like [Amaranthus tricolor]|uniref:acetylajmalan esterase-like n=1 Tax=Amaranthus tricolor TaxID=29722 RepID=UPI00258B3ACC|nr:acetylajmalan esterase-like [Amaranthus tricolor]XP_057523496.1 acetylajmalan esterase-like [Amaranthus tricolor]
MATLHDLHHPHPIIIPPKYNRPNKISMFDSIYQFGDSISDTGNLVIENPIGATNFANYPYGQTIHHPTGRCSDGLLMIDFFAQYFNVPLLMPFLNKQARFHQGVNFAVAGSTALDSASLLSKGVFSPVTNSSLSVQLKWFHSYLDSVCSNTTSQSQCEKKMQRSLFLIETGGNDYNYALLQNKTVEEVKMNMVPEVVGAIKKAVIQIINQTHANHIIVPGNFPIGCLPIYLSSFQSKDQTQYDELGCLKGLNGFAKVHNKALQEAIKEIKEEYPRSKVVYGDYYNALSSVLRDAVALGFDGQNVHNACCGAADHPNHFYLMKMCGSKDASVCSNPARYISWDGIHFTQQAYSLMSDYLLHQILPSFLPYLD